MAASLGAQRQPVGDGPDWPMYNRDLAATRFSPLSRIDTTNVSGLTR
jgi:glucose dehydrogenase